MDILERSVSKRNPQQVNKGIRWLLLIIMNIKFNALGRPEASLEMLKRKGVGLIGRRYKGTQKVQLK